MLLPALTMHPQLRVALRTFREVAAFEAAPSPEPLEPECAPRQASAGQPIRR
ncbi:hypothetical protein GCM10010381_20740 [Streptomyces xantholiticus]|nr:hypothetical protein GCM10010381_20740 [Streptomyces xantholiticus]